MLPNYHKRGQALLILIMVIATILTVILSISFKTQTETQITELEKESKKTLAAAEAAIEAALKSNESVSFNDQALQDIKGYNGQATLDNSYYKKTFISPLLQQDEQYTFYLAKYPDFSDPFNGTLAVYYGSSGVDCNSVALELTLIYDSDTNAATSPEYDIKRYRADTGSILSNTGSQIGSTTSKTIDGETFNCSTSAISIDNGVYPNPKVLFIRFINQSNLSSKIGVERLSGGIETPMKPYLPVQGKYVNSEATSTSGVSKKVQLFQSYPQIPSEFFVTQFHVVP